MKTIGIALVLFVASRVHMTLWSAGVPHTVPVLQFAAVTAGVPLALALIAGLHVLACNYPRICWRTA